MTREELVAEFEAVAERPYEPAEQRWGRVQNKRASRPDLHAFLLLDALLPGASGDKMVSAAEHDTIYLDVDLDALAAVIASEQVMELDDCGVIYSEDNDCLMMFV